MHNTDFREFAHADQAVTLAKRTRGVHDERWGAGVEYHFQEFNEPYAPS